MAVKITLPGRFLIYDIETAPLQAWIWRPGEQVVRHNQLVKGFDKYDIITISYKWYGEKEIYCLDWGYEKQDSSEMIIAFDKLVKEADVVIGKNSDKFDAKHINTQRMLHNLPPIPQWASICDDLEKQLRKYFAFPSQSLDYVSKLLGFGGKDKMEMDDWIKIVKKDEQGGEAAFQKMIKYNKKDVADTEAVLMRVLPYIQLRFNAAGGPLQCVTCGSLDVVEGRVIKKGAVKYQEFECLAHKGYAGKATWGYPGKSHHKTFRKMMP